MNKLLIICGPTATGKTNLALALAKKLDGELVNADSRQIYKGLDALTGKDRSDEVPIWLYDVVGVQQEFSVAHFITLARHAIDDIGTRGKLPIVVGGTGFYLRALTTSIDTIAVPPNRELRDRLGTLSIKTLGQRLQRADSRRWRMLNASDRKNPRRLIRAIEVATSAKYVPQARPSYDTLWIGLASSVHVLKERIAVRIAERFDKAASEVRDGLPPILGVSPLLSFTRGESTKEETLRKWVQAEFQYSKRQLTWFRKDKDIHWFDRENPNYRREVEAIVRGWYT
ncbi:tRNA (adenosine(37)-N6)-dimethylallyltransferase MiaA [Candidatus Gottesmanbacteria bacterium]|nr:tRNA (adenosine(37)-N6)-dimethylallyltransferase MiaA [Candidatus Gottesmanbacteria bacterium]